MKQFSNIYFNGCSFTAGGGLEIPSEEDIHAVWPVKGYKELGLDVYWKHNKEVAYPQRVSDELNIKVINDSIQGGSWNRVVRNFWEYISNNDESNTLFVLEYPGGLRDEFFSTKLNDYILVNTGLTTEFILESIETIQGQRNYNTLKSGDDKHIVYEELQNYYKHLFNPDCNLHFKKEWISLYAICLHCENNKLPLIVTQNRLWEYIDDENFVIKFKELFNKDWEYVNFIEHPKDYCTQKKLLIRDDLEGLIAGYGGTKLIGDNDSIKTEPYGYSDGHPGYHGHIEYGKLLSKKIQEWYK